MHGSHGDDARTQSPDYSVAPKVRAGGHHGTRKDYDPQRNVQHADGTVGEKRQGYYPHGLLGVVGAVTEAHGGGREDLELPKEVVDHGGRSSGEDPGDGDHDQGAAQEGDDG